MKFSELYAIEPQDFEHSLMRVIRLSKDCLIVISLKVMFLIFLLRMDILIWFLLLSFLFILPKDLLNAMKEIYRCSGEYIWGLEYSSHKCEEVCYRGKGNMLWKTDFMQKYLDTFDDLELIKREEILGYRHRA